ncbi:DUF2442 [Desulfonema limicola]|uniref:DUF2442 n=1 Tax=Desulfonema limicola TaxID=45656 RepID=A0A975GHV2_9BACT|nr:DUF2442 domain-containing protein [Desulfonema limicola]QTA81103.1 DUF2442 [Desulfonema limicola]
MTSLAYKTQNAIAVNINISDDTLSIDLDDGRTVSVPLAWFPRLVYSTPQELKNWRLTGKGQGIYWPDPDEDISVSGLLAGRRSDESQRSFEKWLAKRLPLITNFGDKE